jgi:hypothetical protein
MSDEQTKLPTELRQAAKSIEEAAKASPCYSVIHSIVQNTVDHILAKARTIELRER